MKFAKIKEAIQDIKDGKMIVVLDDENRENEGDLIMAGEMCTPEDINFMIKQGGGLICTPVSERLGKVMGLGPMITDNTDPKGTAFTVSVDWKGCRTGISAFERSETIKKLCEEVSPEEFTRPGHIFPLIAKEGGVLQRDGHTEASVDLCRLAGLKEVGVICEIVGKDGQMSIGDELWEFCKENKLKVITIKDLIQYRKENEEIVNREAETKMPTKHGDFRMIGYTEKITGKEHVALVKGKIDKEESVLVRVHSECLTGDAFGSMKCDCGNQLQMALKEINQEGNGVLIYLRQEGRGIGLINKIKAYELQDKGRDTVDANIELGFDEDLREYDTAAAILKDLGVKRVRVMTNNPLKISGLEKFGIEVDERVHIESKCCSTNEKYMRTKMDRMGHVLKMR